MASVVLEVCLTLSTSILQAKYSDIYQLEGQIYRVYAYQLKRQSNLLRSTWLLSGLVDYFPIRLTGVPVAEFEALLSAVFPSEKLYDFQQPRLEDALRAAE
jgi:hypothetical protein